MVITPPFQRKPGEKRSIFLISETLQLLEKFGKDYLQLKRFCFFFFYAVTLNTFRMQTEVCLLINSFIFMQEKDKDEIK